MFYFKQRGKPDDPKNRAAVKQSQLLAETVEIKKIGPLPKTPVAKKKKHTIVPELQLNIHGAGAATPKKFVKRTAEDIVAVRKLYDFSKVGNSAKNTETILQRVEKEVYTKPPEPCKTQPVEKKAEKIELTWEEKAAKLLQEILQDDLLLKPKENKDVMQTIEETQEEIDLATNQLMQINKLIGCQTTSKNKRMNHVERIMQLNERPGWEWMPNKYLDCVINRKCKN